MTIVTKPALAAALLSTLVAAAFAETGRPADYVASAPLDVVDRQADDAFARYEMVVDGASRSPIGVHAQVVERDDVDSYAKYLMVIDGMSRESAIERARARQQSIDSAAQRRLARASR